MSLITTETIAMRRGGRDLIALDRLELAAGSFTVILGPNGAGKTSLLRLLSGETAPDRGRITFDGSDLAQWTPGALALRRAVMVQEQHLDFPLRVVDVAGLGSLARKGRGQASRSTSDWRLHPGLETTPWTDPLTGPREGKRRCARDASGTPKRHLLE